MIAAFISNISCKIETGRKEAFSIGKEFRDFIYCVDRENGRRVEEEIAVGRLAFESGALEQDAIFLPFEQRVVFSG